MLSSIIYLFDWLRWRSIWGQPCSQCSYSSSLYLRCYQPVMPLESPLFKVINISTILFKILGQKNESFNYLFWFYLMSNFILFFVLQSYLQRGQYALLVCAVTLHHQVPVVVAALLLHQSRSRLTMINAYPF